MRLSARLQYLHHSRYDGADPGVRFCCAPGRDGDTAVLAIAGCRPAENAEWGVA